LILMLPSIVLTIQHHLYFDSYE